MNHRIAVAISGGGRSLANLIKNQDQFRYKIAAVIASSDSCKGLQFAEQNHLPTLIQNFKLEPELVASKVRSFLKEQQIGWVALAGFLKKFPVLEDFKRKIVNIHPALLPEFGGPGMYGQKVHAAVLSAKKTQSGASIHFISERYDEGPLLSQILVDIKNLESADAIAERVFAAECELYPKTLDKLVTGELPLPASDIWQLRYRG